MCVFVKEWERDAWCRSIHKRVSRFSSFFMVSPVISPKSTFAFLSWGLTSLSNLHCTTTLFSFSAKIAPPPPPAPTVSSASVSQPFNVKVFEPAPGLFLPNYAPLKIKWWISIMLLVRPLVVTLLSLFMCCCCQFVCSSKYQHHVPKKFPSLCTRERANVVLAETKSSQDTLLTTAQHYPGSEKHTQNSSLESSSFLMGMCLQRTRKTTTKYFTVFPLRAEHFP